MANKHQVAETLKAHPDWTSTQISEHLDCMPEYVRTTVKRLGMKFARSKGQRVLGGSIHALGQACRDAGITLQEISAIARRRAS